MGDLEYAAAFSEVVLPLLSHFKPDLILIACGLDAVQGDLLGDCGLSTEMYYTMTRAVIESLPSPKTPIVVALEGGYNIAKSSECMHYVALAILDEPKDLSERQMTVAWTTASILPQRPHLPLSKRETTKMHQLAESCVKLVKKTSVSRIAIKAIKRSANALEHTGGTCLCGCHFKCHHSNSLPMKKRKFSEM